MKKFHVFGKQYQMSQSSYNRLMDYLEELRAYIVANEMEMSLYHDFETSIEEKLDNKEKHGKISNKDMQEILEEVGSPEEIFEGEEIGTNPKKEENKETEKITPRKKRGVLGTIGYIIGQFFVIIRNIIRHIVIFVRKYIIIVAFKVTFFLLKRIFKLGRKLIAYTGVFGLIVATGSLIITGCVLFYELSINNQIIFHDLRIAKVSLIGLGTFATILLVGLRRRISKKPSFNRSIGAISVLGIIVSIGGLAYSGLKTMDTLSVVHTQKEILRFDIQDTEKNIQIEGLQNTVSDNSWHSDLQINFIDKITIEKEHRNDILLEFTTKYNQADKETAQVIKEALLPIKGEYSNGIINFPEQDNFNKVVPYAIMRRNLLIKTPKDIYIEIPGHKNNYTYFHIERDEDKKIIHIAEPQSSELRIEKVLEVSCTQDSDCETPGEYLIMSHCPYTSQCINNQCTVVCPPF